MNKNKPFKSENTVNIPADNPAKQLPSIFDQAKNLLTSTVKHVVGGLPQTSDPTQLRRLEICRSCDRYNQNDPDNPRCNECGCFLKVKTSWAGESCPLGKWSSEKISNNEDCDCKG